MGHVTSSKQHHNSGFRCQDSEESRIKYNLLDEKEVGNSSNSLLDNAYWCIFHQGVDESAELGNVADLLRSSENNL